MGRPDQGRGNHGQRIEWWRHGVTPRSACQLARPTFLPGRHTRISSDAALSWSGVNMTSNVDMTASKKGVDRHRGEESESTPYWYSRARLPLTTINIHRGNDRGKHRGNYRGICFFWLDKWLHLVPFDLRVHELVLQALADCGRLREGDCIVAAWPSRGGRRLEPVGGCKCPAQIAAILFGQRFRGGISAM